MRIKSFLKVLLLFGALSLGACENDGPSLVGSGEGGSNAPTGPAWTLYIEREDPIDNSLVVTFECVNGSNRVETIADVSAKSYSLKCRLGDSIQIQLSSGALGGIFEDFLIDNAPLSGWHRWDSSKALPSPYELSDSFDGKTVTIKATQPQG